MSELTRARDDDMDDDHDSLDSLERAQWRGIGARVEALKVDVDDDTKPPPTDSSPPIKSDDESVGGNDPREMGLVAKYVGLKHKVKTLTKENKDLKREIEEMKTVAIESASASNGRSTKNCDGDRKIVVSHLHSSNLFKIPDGLDLEDKTKVDEWYVRYDELFIVYKNGQEQTIGVSQEQEANEKEPKATIEDADSWCFEYDSFPSVPEDDDEEDDDEDDGA